VRKQLAGLAPSDRAPDDAYSDYLTIQTYRELGARAAENARARGVIVDATFRSRVQRGAFAEGFGEGLPVPLYVTCSAPEPLLLKRARERELDPTRISDAGPDIVTRQAGELEPFDEIPADRVFELRTDRPSDESADRVEAWLDDLLAP
jgi:predicted kinase